MAGTFFIWLWIRSFVLSWSLASIVKYLMNRDWWMFKLKSKSYLAGMMFVLWSFINFLHFQVRNAAGLGLPGAILTERAYLMTISGIWAAWWTCTTGTYQATFCCHTSLSVWLGGVCYDATSSPCATTSWDRRKHSLLWMACGNQTLCFQRPSESRWPTGCSGMNGCQARGSTYFSKQFWSDFSAITTLDSQWLGSRFKIDTIWILSQNRFHRKDGAKIRVQNLEWQNEIFLAFFLIYYIDSDIHTYIHACTYTVSRRTLYTNQMTDIYHFQRQIQQNKK